MVNNKKSKSVRIIDMPAPDAREAMMKNDFYSTVELPKYFDFSGVLAYARESIGDKTLAQCTVKGKSAESLPGVNLDVLTNKDGRYAVRPLTLANPFLYYMLVRDITAPKAWAAITECFDLYADPCIRACSIPMVPVDDDAWEKQLFKNAPNILNWWRSVEQASLELSLKYSYMFVADITNCFGQINPEAISWALARKGTSHETKANARLADKIQVYLRAMQQGRNIGIPQGSSLFNLIAEIILGYTDMLLAQEIARAQRAGDLPDDLDYQVLRYVDDYRIFCNSHEALDKISYILQRLLQRFNFNLNTGKTRITADLVADSIKPDKLFYIFNTPISLTRTTTDADGNSVRETSYDFAGLQKHLLFIYEFSRRFPNSGQLVCQLNGFSKRIEELVEKKKKRDEARCKRVQLWEVVDLDIEPQAAAATATVDDPEDFLDYVPEDPADDEPDLSYVPEDPADDEPDDLEEPEDPNDAPAAHKNIFDDLTKYSPRGPIIESIPPMVAIAVEIARNNPRAANHALRVASQLIKQMPDYQKDKRDEIIHQIYQKLRHTPNSAFLQVWLQNITFDTDDWSTDAPYDMPLCLLAASRPVAIWNNAWLLPSIAAPFPQATVIDRDALLSAHQLITFKHKPLYDEI